jgi:hypothetical protein
LVFSAIERNIPYLLLIVILFFLTKRSKKQIIAGLLFACCIASAILLFTMPSGPNRSLDNPSQADSLLHLTFHKFDLKKGQIYTDSIKVDSNFVRKNYVISAGPNFPTTKFHVALNNQLHSYNIKLPARVIFPDQGIRIQLIYHHTIITTIKLFVKKTKKG